MTVIAGLVHEGEEIGLHDHDVEHQHVADVGDANDERPLITCDAGEAVDADE